MRFAFVSSLVSCFLAYTAPVLADPGFLWTGVSGLVSNVAQVGNAYYSAASSSIVLTDPINNQASAVWANQLIKVKQGWNISFAYKFTQNPSSLSSSCQYNNMDADGIVFVINPNDVTQIGAIAENIGYNFANNFAVEFDTYVNSDFSDPSDYHVGIQSCGTAQNSGDHNGNCAVVAPQLLPSCFDNVVHVANVIYDPTTGNVTVFHDGVQVITAAFNFNSLNLINGDSAYFGVTSTTGGFNSRQELYFLEYDAYTAPTTQAPTTQAPTSAAPTSASTTAAPTQVVTTKPTTQAPTSASPTTQAPTPAPCPSVPVSQAAVGFPSYNIVKGQFVWTQVYQINIQTTVSIWSLAITITPPTGFTISNVWGLTKNADGTYAVVDTRFTNQRCVTAGSTFGFIGYQINGAISTSIAPATVTSRAACTGQCGGKVQLIPFNQWGCGTYHFVHYKIAYANSGVHLASKAQLNLNLPANANVFTTFNLAASSSVTAAGSGIYTASLYDLAPGSTFSETGFIVTMPVDRRGRYTPPTITINNPICS